MTGHIHFRNPLDQGRKELFQVPAACELIEPMSSMSLVLRRRLLSKSSRRTSSAGGFKSGLTTDKVQLFAKQSIANEGNGSDNEVSDCRCELLRCEGPGAGALRASAR